MLIDIKAASRKAAKCLVTIYGVPIRGFLAKMGGLTADRCDVIMDVGRTADE